jgi:dienelactone hydrolase
LVIPKDNLNKDKKYPLVIGVAGSEGWKKHHYDYLILFQEMGYATFELNSFKSRNIKSTVGRQNQVTVAAMVNDVYKALDVLSNHPKINKNEIAITGWSLGGGVTLFSAWKPIMKALGKQNSFKSHLAFYPPCFFNFEELDFGDSPVHILIGESDDWTPAEPCKNFVLQLNKPNINITVYENAHHGFDREGNLEFNENGYSFKDCMFDVNIEGDILMNYLNIPMSNPFLQKLGFIFCVSRGVTIGGNASARKKSFEFAKQFMLKTLSN